MSLETAYEVQTELGGGVNLRVVCRQQNYDLTLGSQALRVIGEDSDVSIPLKAEERLFTRHLLMNPDNGFLQGEIKEKTSIKESEKIDKVYASTIKSLSSHMIRDNFINYDKGRSTKYALLQNSEYPDVLISRERSLINESLVSDRRKAKRLDQISLLEEFYYGSEKHKFSKRKIVGMIATGSVLVVGGVVFGVYRNIEK